MLPPSNVRESTTFPVSSGVPTSLKEDGNDAWSQHIEREEYEISEEMYDQPKISWKKNGKLDSFPYTSEDKIRTAKGQAKLKDQSKVDAKSLDSDDDDLNDLLQVRLLSGIL